MGPYHNRARRGSNGALVMKVLEDVFWGPLMMEDLEGSLVVPYDVRFLMMSQTSIAPGGPLVALELFVVTDLEQNPPWGPM